MRAKHLRILGLISGTSVDGVDAVIADITGEGFHLQVDVIAGQTTPYPAELRQRILAICGDAAITLATLAELDDAIAQHFAQTAQTLMDQQGAVELIASHGQTVFHRPPSRPDSSTLDLGYSLQLGRGEQIAALTQCPTINNFRQADIAAGGEGAPLVPPVDLALLSHPQHWRCIQNIGGIGNVAILPPWDSESNVPPPQVLGWDTGPGNSLLDLAVEFFSNGQLAYDQDGTWAAQGTPNTSLVEQWLQHPYFAQRPPKSTGRELFGQAFLDTCLESIQTKQLAAADALATLTEFTAVTITHSYQQFLPTTPDEILLCGGGSHNQYLVQRLQHHCPQSTVGTTAMAGVPVDFKEALAFAVLGYWHNQRFPGNLPSVTGATRPVCLGDFHPPLAIR